jgi:Reverse transcriptase (RNA-dependent DNA polymerase)
VATSGSQQISTDKVSIKRGLFQGDTFSPLWFCLGLNPLSILLEDSGIGFDIKFGLNEKFKISHLFYMDDVKLYASTHAQLKELYAITEKISSSIRMEFGIEKCRT